MRVPYFLSSQTVHFESILHPPAYSAQKRARYLHVPGRQVVKAVLINGPDGDFLAVLPATRHIDLAKLQRVMGGAVRLATTDRISRIFSDCEVGAVHPFGSLYNLPSIIDESVDSEADIVFEGHMHCQTIRMNCRDYERLERPQRLEFTM